MTNKINGIDVSEEIRYCNNCSNLGLDFKTGNLINNLWQSLTDQEKEEIREILNE